MAPRESAHQEELKGSSRPSTVCCASTAADHRQFEVPQDHGLLMHLHADGRVTIETEPDQHYPEIHPHCYAPKSLRDVRLLHGGGSGTAVFGGVHPTLQAIVMKHGGSKDTKEVFSLATIADELLQRKKRLCDEQQQHQASPSSSSSRRAVAAAENMKGRIPEFVMVYISPYHVRERGKELWNVLRTITYSHSGKRLSLSFRNIPTLLSPSTVNDITLHRSRSHNNLNQEEAPTESSPFHGDNIVDLFDNSSAATTGRRSSQQGRRSSQHLSRPPSMDDDDDENSDQKRWLCVHTGTKVREAQIGTRDGLVEIRVPGCDDDARVVPAGVQFLQEFKEALMEQQEEHSWKITLAQKWIGGPDASNGADVLTSGRLQGTLLDTLIREFTSVMQDLETLTLPEERHGVLERVRKEVHRLEELGDVKAVSKETDYFVGRAVLKNFHPSHGRFRNLRLQGDDFREGGFFLTDPERAPAEFLGRTLQRGALLQDIFVDAPDTRSALDRMEDRGWLDILKHATQFENCPSATDCIWTCGLTDAGLHNTFLSEERGLEIFDLGVPDLQPRPAFLTKFLMSFFHTLGMENDGGASWKTRFAVVEVNESDQRLTLTAETKEKIPYIHRVFTTTVDHFIQNIFNGNEAVRQLLIKYVILQLLSDSSFCLRRWESKGGGSKRYGERLQYAMEKWLWRSLWDQYIACYVHANLLNE